MSGNASRGPVNPRLIQPGGVVHTRIAPDVKVPDVEEQPNTYIVTGLMELARQIGNVARLIENKTKRVDEYRTQTLATDVETRIEVLPQFEIPELIESIILAGPAGAVTLQLGDRVLSVVIPATQILVIGPLGMLLTRQDIRAVTAGAAGDYFLELMGYADARY